VAQFEVKCPQCSKTVAVSPTAHSDALVCHFCGAKLPRTVGFKPARQLKFKEEEPSPAAGGEGPSTQRATVASMQEAVAKSAAKRIRQRAPRRRSAFGGPVASWILFVLLGGGAAAMRYGNLLSEEHLKLIPQYGPIVVIVLQVVILIKAFGDSVFQGILCLLIPFYSLYYLFTACDDFVLRAIVAGSLIGVGQDSAIVIQEKLGSMASSVNAWIQSGG
jgi:hypothetical protein